MNSGGSRQRLGLRQSRNDLPTQPGLTSASLDCFACTSSTYGFRRDFLDQRLRLAIGDAAGTHEESGRLQFGAVDLNQLAIERGDIVRSQLSPVRTLSVGRRSNAYVRSEFCQRPTDRRPDQRTMAA